MKNEVYDFHQHICVRPTILFADTNMLVNLAISYRELGEIVMDRGKIIEAEILFKEAVGLIEGEGARGMEEILSYCYYQLGRIAAGLMKTKESKVWLKKAHREIEKWES